MASNMASEHRNVKILTICGLICVLGLAGMENIVIFYVVRHNTTIPPFILGFLIVLTLLVIIGFVTLGFAAAQLEKMRRVAVGRHELANHFNVVLGHLSMGNPERALAYARRVTYASAESDILDAKIDAGAFGMISQAIGKLLARGIRVEAEVRVRPHELVSLGLNPSTLIGNLLDNAATAALKANPPDVPTVMLQIHHENSFVCIKVWNNGAYIPKEDLGRVMESGYTTKSDSAGLGLAVCKVIVEQARGWIHINSSRQHGTLVDVRVPMWESGSMKLD